MPRSTLKAVVQSAIEAYGVVVISIGGVHRLPDRESTKAELIKLADQALLFAKQCGGNRAHIVA